MITKALLATFEAKPGKEEAVEKFLKNARPLVLDEPDTLTWYAVKLGPAKFGIFDTFPSEDGRRAHLSGEVAKALMEGASELFESAPQIVLMDVVAVK